MVLENTTNQVLGILPGVLGEKIVILLQAIGGIFFLYLIFLIIQLYLKRKEVHMIEKINKDLDLIKKKLKIRDKK